MPEKLEGPSGGFRQPGAFLRTEKWNESTISS
jgi:hypothetical protein